MPWRKLFYTNVTNSTARVVKITLLSSHWLQSGTERYLEATPEISASPGEEDAFGRIREGQVRNDPKIKKK